VGERVYDVVLAHHDRMVLVLRLGPSWPGPKDPQHADLAMLTAMHCSAELKLHVRGAIQNGVSVDEIKEILLHATAYSGIPAGLEAFKAANEIPEKMGLIPTPE